MPRPRLDGRLARVARQPLMLVSASAGYGKTTLVSAWLEHSGRRGAWLSLDAQDNNLGLFETYILAAIRTLAPSFGEDMSAALEGVAPIPIRTYVDDLHDELDRVADDVILVLDDYNVITDGEIHALIGEMLHHPHPLLHLVLITRHDPPLPLNDWRARDWVSEIRPTDLRFSSEEAETFLRLAVDQPLAGETIASLHEKTEGWIAGLRLAALSLARIEDFEGRVAELSGSNAYITDYLLRQVLGDLPASVQALLLESSILDRLSAPLCRAVVSPDVSLPAGRNILKELEQANLFVIPLDDRGQWFRFHHLFQQFLQNRLAAERPAEAIRALHLRASAWFAENDYVDEALFHSLQAGSTETAIRLAADNRHTLMNQERWQRLSRRLDLFPQTVIDESPELLLLQAWLAHVRRFDIAALRVLLDRLDALIERLDPELERARLLQAESDILRGAVRYFALDAAGSLACCRRGLDVLPPDCYAARNPGWNYGAAALQMMGDLDGAYQWIRAGEREDAQFEGGSRARNGGAAGYVDWMIGDLAGVRLVGEHLLAVASSGDQRNSLGWAHYFLACADYHRNDLDGAEYHARQAFDQRYINHAPGNIYCGFILALVHQARGRPKQAREVTDSISAYAAEIRSAPQLKTTQSFQAELAVMQGRAGEAMYWVDQAFPTLQTSPMPFFYSPQLTAPKALLATGGPENLSRAAGCLQRLHEHAEAIHNVRLLIEVLALEAMCHDCCGDQDAAFAALSRSLSLAQPGGFIRLYVDLGPRMADLMRRMWKRGHHTDYIRLVLHAFADAPPGAGPFAGAGGLLEPLTDRETEILSFLAQRYSNKEIAARLVISPVTVKRHTINIYQKLGVNSRKEAVAAARTLSLLEA